MAAIDAHLLSKACDSHLAKAEPKKTRVGEYVKKHGPKLAKKIAAALHLQASKFARSVRRMKKVELTDEQQAIIDDILSQLDADGVAVSIVDELTPELEAAFKEAGFYGVGQVGFDTAAGGKDITGQLDEAALKYAQERSTELIKDFADTTKEDLQATIAQGVADGMSTSELADMIEETGAFGEARADMIARTELAFAHVQGNVEGWRATGEVQGKEWILGDLHDVADECDECADAGIVDLEEEFIPGYDFPPAHPNCFLPGTVVAAIGLTNLFERRFEGKVIKVGIAGMDGFTVTPNHPILTRRGWIAAGTLKIGDELFHCSDPSWAVASMSPNDNQMSTRIEDVFASLVMNGKILFSLLPTSAEDFHGDGMTDGEVYVVRPDCRLSVDIETCAHQREECLALGIGNELELLSTGRGSFGEFRISAFSAANSGVGSGSVSTPLLRCAASSDGNSFFATSSEDESCIFKKFPEVSAFDADTICDTYPGLTGLIRVVQVSEIREDNFCGHVYNLSTKVDWYFANGIITHNCVCDVIPVLREQQGDSNDDATSAESE